MLSARHVKAAAASLQTSNKQHTIYTCGERHYLQDNMFLLCYPVTLYVKHLRFSEIDEFFMLCYHFITASFYTNNAYQWVAQPALNLAAKTFS